MSKSHFDRSFTEEELLSKDNLTSSRILKGETIIGEEQLLRLTDGREYPIVVAGGPIFDPSGKQIGGVTFFQDITPLKELEQLREEWAAVIAHDLRQPITAIQLSAGVLKTLSECSEQVSKMAGMIESSARQLNRMTHDLLEVSQLEANKLKLEPVDTDILALLDQVVKKLTPMFPDNPITLEATQPTSNVKVDPGRIEQVIGNLISNAVKYGFPGKPVILKVQQVEERIEISVINQGVGIESKDLSKLFQRFHRTSFAKKEGIKGIGLGLYLTKGLIEAHGGHIQAESIPGKTTTFRIELPIES